MPQEQSARSIDEATGSLLTKIRFERKYNSTVFWQRNNDRVLWLPQNQNKWMDWKQNLNDSPVEWTGELDSFWICIKVRRFLVLHSLRHNGNASIGLRSNMSLIVFQVNRNIRYATDIQLFWQFYHCIVLWIFFAFICIFVRYVSFAFWIANFNSEPKFNRTFT